MNVESASSAGERAQAFPETVAPGAVPLVSVQAPDPPPDLASAIVEMAPDGILIVGPDGLVSFANPAAADIFQYPHHAMPGLAIEVLVPDGLRSVHARHRPGYDAVARPAATGPGRCLMARRRDGTEVPVEVSVSPVRLEGSPATIAVVRRAAEQRASEVELRRHLLVEEDERIAHELNDRIVKRLFLAGMKIQSVLQLTDSPIAQQLNETVDQLDTAIREIRRTVFAGCLSKPGGPVTPDVN